MNGWKNHASKIKANCEERRHASKVNVNRSKTEHVPSNN